MADQFTEGLVARETGTQLVKRGLAEMLKGGVIMDVVDPEQARIAEDAGAVAVMALERVPSDIRRDGGVARMSDPEMIEGIKAVTTIPVMAKARIGHFVEAQILQALGVDYVDESEVLTPADEAHHIDKWAFTVPFVCGATNLGEALRRISEGACLIRSKGEAGTGNIVEAVRHLRSILGDIRKITTADQAELFDWAKKLQAPLPLVQEIAETGTLPVPMFCAGGIATPADAALVMQLGAQSVFVGSGIFKSDDPATRAKAIVEATTNFRDADILAKVSRGLGAAMPGLEIGSLDIKLADRGWWAAPAAHPRPPDRADAAIGASRCRPTGSVSSPCRARSRCTRAPWRASVRPPSRCARRLSWRPSTPWCCPAVSPPRCRSCWWRWSSSSRWPTAWARACPPSAPAPA
jgi:pyridoxal 5'-phosphate synthase pdxS subunit